MIKSENIKHKKIQSIDYLHYFIFSIILIMNVMFFNNNIYILITSIIYFTVVSLLDLSNGLALFVLSLPANNFMKSHFSLINYVLILMALLIMISLLNFLSNPKKIEKKSFIYITIFLFLNLFSLILNFNKITHLLSQYGMLMISISYLFIYINMPNKKELYSKSKFVYVLSAINIIMLVLHFNDWQFTGFTDRIKLENIISVRRLADLIAPAVIIVFSNIFFKSNKKPNKLLFLGEIVLLLFLLYFLLLTGTRGVLYPVIFALTFIFLIKSFDGFNINIKTIAMIPILALLLVVMYGFRDYLPDFISRLQDFDNSSRVAIWLNGLKQLNLFEFIFGRGLNRFWELSKMGDLSNYRLEWYTPHSIYLDILTSSGIISLILLISMFYYFLKKSFIQNKHFIMALTIYLIIAGITGIPVIEIGFWTLIGFIYLSLGIQEQQQTKKAFFINENKESII